ncbi:MAG: lon [Gammaproteobacteria bacterium]|jgi:ATP-dependent Lon protease|nr:lon [Gammaproteobacteria bacterium]
MEEKTTAKPTSQTKSDMMPVLPLRDVVVFPQMVIPLFVGRKGSVAALEAAMQKDKQIFLVSQKNATEDEPSQSELYRIGTVATVLQLLKLPDGTVKILVEGLHRAKAVSFHRVEKGYFETQLEPISITFDEKEATFLARNVLTNFENYVAHNKKIPPEILPALAAIEDPLRLADTIAAHLTLKLQDRQKLLEMTNLLEMMEHLIVYMETEIDLLQVDKRVRGNIKKQMEKSQREYYLNEQIKAIQKELGDLEDGGKSEFEVFADRIKKSGMPKEAREKAEAELKKLKMMPPMAAEATVVRNYLDWLLNIPWKKHSKIIHDLKHAEEVLDEDHYGLEKVKERIIEFLAVQSRVKKIKGPVLCLVGPPGVGKTSLGQSIARATGRAFVRMALGGVRDEAEIRGHRRTYIGSMPGRIMQKMMKVKVKNPLFLLDEIDKMAMDFRGDPAAAMLEVLDPEQNHTFMDHYLEVDYDLSNVLFIATANSMNIPAPLLDRMEVIRLPGYTEDEKLNIAKRYLLKKQIEANGLKLEELKLMDSAIIDIIRFYTREAGVRNLEREIAKICRKVVRELASKEGKNKEVKQVVVTSANLEKYLGVQRFRYGKAEEYDQVGQVVGLAWTEVGGELLTIEAAVMPGKGKVTTTGQLGNVMQESIQAALTVVRSRSEALGLPGDFYEKYDIHVHVPEGATPKDGPSAGIGMCTALVSALTKNPVKADVAMTGEITLRGEVLPIGGLKEKLLAAHRGGVKTVIIPDENKRDLKDIPKNITDGLDIRPVRWIDEVLALALKDQLKSKTQPTVARKKASKKQVTSATKKKKTSQAVVRH